MQDDVKPIAVAYAGVGVLMAILELITVAVAFAYVAQIGRKIRREENMWRHTEGDRHGDAADAALNHGHGDTMV